MTNTFGFVTEYSCLCCGPVKFWVRHENASDRQMRCSFCGAKPEPTGTVETLEDGYVVTRTNGVEKERRLANKVKKQSCDDSVPYTADMTPEQIKEYDAIAGANPLDEDA